MHLSTHIHTHTLTHEQNPNSESQVRSKPFFALSGRRLSCSHCFLVSIPHLLEYAEGKLRESYVIEVAIIRTYASHKYAELRYVGGGSEGSAAEASACLARSNINRIDWDAVRQACCSFCSSASHESTSLSMFATTDLSICGKVCHQKISSSRACTVKEYRLILLSVPWNCA